MAIFQIENEAAKRQIQERKKTNYMDCSSLPSPSALGIIGTILGTVMGFFLQRISRIGRIKFFQNSVTFKLYESDNRGGYTEVQALTEGEEDYFSLIVV